MEYTLTNEERAFCLEKAALSQQAQAAAAGLLEFLGRTHGLTGKVTVTEGYRQLVSEESEGRDGSTQAMAEPAGGIAPVVNGRTAEY